MSQYFQIHPKDPQPRLIKRTVEILRSDGIIVYPTDSSYALGCRMDSKTGLDTIRRIRRLDDNHNFTLVCSDISQVSNFARMENDSFRMMKSLTPGPFTFILLATRETPKRIQHVKKKSIGIRLPDDPITQAIVEELQEPLFSSTLILPDAEDALSDPEEIRDLLEHQVDLVIDAGPVPYEPTTIIDCTGERPEIVRQGKVDVPSLH